jgi:NADH dehydrogenase/NADH:ubiquinone oxidoreductase subunit G
MYPFKSFVVESDLSNDEERQVSLVFNTYLKYFNPRVLGNTDPKVAYKKRLQPDGTMVLGSIKYYDEVKRKEGKAYVVVNFDQSLGDAEYDRKNDTITLYYQKYSKLTNGLKRNKIVHELFHAKDYKKPTAEYIKATSGNTVGSKRDYYTAKNEFPVQIAAIIHEINLQQKELHRRSKSGTGMSFWKNRRNLLLQSIANLINATKMTEVVVPQFLADYKGFIDTLYRNKNNPSYQKFYNEYKQKLKQLYSNIQRTKFASSYEGEARDNI